MRFQLEMSVLYNINLLNYREYVGAGWISVPRSKFTVIFSTVFGIKRWKAATVVREDVCHVLTAFSSNVRLELLSALL